MAKSTAASTLFVTASPRQRRVLILSKYLYGPDPQNLAEAQYHHDSGPDFDQAHALLKKWAAMETNGLLKKKETALDANFLNDIFGNALRYTPVENSTDGTFTLDRQLTVPSVGPVDGALGFFPTDKTAPKPLAVIELKGADTDLDTDKSNGRTAVQQLFDYLNALPDTQWGIVSNFSTIRLYRKSDSQAFISFSLQKLAADLDHFKAFWCLFEKGGLLPSPLAKIPRADRLFTQTGERQKEVGDELYSYYSIYRNALIASLRDDFQKPLDEAVRIAQKIFDRIIFVAFCEDRGLITQKSIERANRDIPAFAKIKNPRWQNFVGLFHFIDKGHPSIGITHGYNGGLFAEDQAIDDLDLPDVPWTNVFGQIASYDFKDEVNVDVLGHIFERSITELEKLRVTGLFSKDAIVQTNGTQPTVAPSASSQKPKMQKSAERKRFGIYYTPPEFTRFIVKQTVEELLLQRFKDLELAHGVTPDELAADFQTLSPRLQAYYQQCLQTLRHFKIVDPACGSGAFLIAAYELLEDYYDDITRHLIAQGVEDAPLLRDRIPDFILKENLYGVDLSEEAVEITRLALWIRSARPGRTLADLTHNVLCGNSLVDDTNVHPRAMNWQVAFPDIFNRSAKGFDAVIGNPPWERIKLQEREFFAFSAPDIASAVSAATRRKLIEVLIKKDPELHARYLAKQSEAEKTSHHVRASNRFPLTAQGDINTYMLFAELARTLVAPAGRVGILVPSGIATDNTTKEFFADIVDSEALITLYDFENRLGVFPDVDSRFKFCTLILGGTDIKTSNADFLFFGHKMDDLKDRKRHISLSKRDIALLNPNTKTCPIFRSHGDAEITKAIYRRVPILHDRSRKSGGNPWELSFATMFHQTNDAELFTEPEKLKSRKCNLRGNIWVNGTERFLPLYEAKMIQAYDHRAASVLISQENWMRQGQTIATSLVEHQNPEFAVQPRWWVKEAEVRRTLPNPDRKFLLGFKDITSPTNQRTMIAAATPIVAVTNHFPLLFTQQSADLELCLLANLNSLILDFVARQKIGGVTLNFFIVEQLPILPPSLYANKCPWDRSKTLRAWLSERVAKLVCTSDDLLPLARELGFQSAPHKWQDDERREIKAEIDAAFLLQYGVNQRELPWIFGAFAAAQEDHTIDLDLILDKFNFMSRKHKGDPNA